MIEAPYMEKFPALAGVELHPLDVLKEEATGTPLSPLLDSPTFLKNAKLLD